MNQSITFIDGFDYLPDGAGIKINALVAGQIIPCFIINIESDKFASFYADYQFDIEDVLEQKLKNEQWNENGEVILSAENI